jgi:CopG family nickel-responsive transcriptional regulator
MSGVSRFGVSIETTLLDRFDTIIEQKGYTNRSEAIRDLIREFLVVKEWQQDIETVGVLSLVYSHHSHELQEKLSGMQHDYHEAVISSTHIHLDKHNCLEVVILKEKSSIIKKISEKLSSTRGVKHGKLMMTTTGSGID